MTEPDIGQRARTGRRARTRRSPSNNDPMPMRPSSQPRAEEPGPDEMAAAVAIASVPRPTVVSTPESPRWTPLGEQEAVLEPRRLSWSRRQAPKTARRRQRRTGRRPSPSQPRRPLGPPGRPEPGLRRIGDPGGDPRHGRCDQGRGDRRRRHRDRPGRPIPRDRRLVRRSSGRRWPPSGSCCPWSSVVIGAAHTGGYFDGWGLASPDPRARAGWPPDRPRSRDRSDRPSRPGCEPVCSAWRAAAS